MSQLLSVRDLKVHFPVGNRGTVHAVDGVDFTIPHGKTLGIVGESGSGKTTTALAIMRLAPITGGEIDLDGTPISRIQGEDLRRARTRFQMVFQDPFSSLNPRDRVGRIIRQPMDLLGLGEPSDRDTRVEELLQQVGLRPELKSLYPHQFSGGQRQRIGLARALATRPELIVFDEPVSALDVAVQAQVLNLIRRLQRESGLTYLFISHDLGVVRHICDEIAVMYLGQIVERAPAAQIFAAPRHPYTQALIAAAPRLHPSTGDGVAVRGCKAIPKSGESAERVPLCIALSTCN
ncbi:ABC transporter ATP-binding protein [Paracoccus aerius]